MKRLVAGEVLPPLPPPPVASADPQDDKRPTKAPRPAKEFPGDVPDPEPVVG